MNTTMFELKSKNCTYDKNVSFDEKLIFRMCVFCMYNTVFYDIA